MDDTMITAIMSIASTLVGTILGSVITILHEEWNKKSKIVLFISTVRRKRNKTRVLN